VEGWENVCGLLGSSSRVGAGGYVGFVGLGRGGVAGGVVWRWWKEEKRPWGRLYRKPWFWFG
jgi:hypothetical protein